MSTADLLDNSQIISPQRVGTIGSEEINKHLQRAIHGKAEVERGGWKVGEQNFMDGDKVIQTKNDYGIGVMNGETGTVSGSVGNGKYLSVRIDGVDRTLERTQTATFQLGYAITIHKSQGSQWPLVVVVCHSSQQRMLARRLFYTAITRSSARVVIVGDDAGFEKAVTNNTDTNRRTYLRDLLVADQ
jgi:exodeoxyribonuclease V alpha subunit